VISNGKQRIASMSDSKEYEECLVRFIKEGLEFMPKGEEVIIVGNSRDRKILGIIIGKLRGESQAKITLSEESASTVGGVIVRSGDGSTAYDNTIETRIDKLGRELRYNIARIFSGGT
jgi:V/A-type H+-transporting ATPase subunit E